MRFDFEITTPKAFANFRPGLERLCTKMGIYTLLCAPSDVFSVSQWFPIAWKKQPPRHRGHREKTPKSSESYIATFVGENFSRAKAQRRKENPLETRQRFVPCHKFDATDIKEMLRRYRFLLEGIVANPEARVSELLKSFSFCRGGTPWPPVIPIP